MRPTMFQKQTRR